MIRDLCPIHGKPMWWTPSDGTWACQIIECEATVPKGLFADTFAWLTDQMYMTAGIPSPIFQRHYLINQPPNEFFKGPFSYGGM